MGVKAFGGRGHESAYQEKGRKGRGEVGEGSGKVVRREVVIGVGIFGPY